MLGNSCLRTGINDKASDYYLKVLSLLGVNFAQNMKKMADVHLTLGTIFETNNNSEVALEHYTKSHQLKAQIK